MNMSDFWLRVGMALVPPAAAPMFSMDITVPFIGVPVNVVVGACAGAASGFGFAPPEESRKKLFWTALTSVVFSCAVVALVEGFTKYWLKVEVESKYLAALALLLSLLGRFLVPAVIERLPGWLDKVPFLKTPKPPQGD